MATSRRVQKQGGLKELGIITRDGFLEQKGVWKLKNDVSDMKYCVIM